MGGIFLCKCPTISSCNPVCVQCHLHTVLNFPQPAFVYLLLFNTLYPHILSNCFWALIYFSLSASSWTYILKGCWLLMCTKFLSKSTYDLVNNVTLDQSLPVSLARSHIKTVRGWPYGWPGLPACVTGIRWLRSKQGNIVLLILFHRTEHRHTRPTAHTQHHRMCS